jgi:hypothetical protein
MVRGPSHGTTVFSKLNNCFVVAQFFLLDDIHILCTTPPRCVLFQHFRSRTVFNFHSLDENIIPVFPIDRSITIKSYSIRRKQVPMCAAFSITDYKSQSQTFSEAVVDLRNGAGIKGRDSHRSFCSFNVQVSRLISQQGLNLLQKIQMSDVNFQPHPDLVSEMETAQALERETLAAWERTGDD